VIRIDRRAEVAPGVWEYSVSGYPQIRGRSRQPRLDACRQLKSMGGLTDHIAGLFRRRMEVADIFCVVRVGAELTVSEPSGTGKVRFVKYRAFEADRILEAA
jgi:hypothetical protein